MVKEYACRQCRMLTNGRVCPNCHSTDLSPHWTSLIIITDVDKSQVSKTLNIVAPGRYALKVS